MMHIPTSLVLRYSKFVYRFNKNCIRFYSTPKPKVQPSVLALNHFDQFYSPVFKNWPSIRLALLCPHYYCAVVNVFSNKVLPEEIFHDMDIFNMRDMYCLNLAKTYGDSEANNAGDTESAVDSEIIETKFDFSSISSETTNESPTASEPQEDYMPATRFKNLDPECDDYAEYYDFDVNYKAQLVPHGTIHYPKNWEIYFCARGKFTKFPAPKPDVNGLLNYYLMDGASILPVLALDIQKGEDVGDLCASPGGKTLSVLFGMQFGKLVCNDVSLSRLNKLKTVLNLYLPGTEEWSKRILVSNLDVADWNYFDAFDKILLDVPCTNDRLSVNKDNNNKFAQKRFNERMLLPKLQTSMLCAALKALKPGGSLVYSTCSLSPIQNDGVVHMSLAKLANESKCEYTVNDLKQSFLPLQNMFQFSDNCRYGQLVVPYLPLNYGPMYIAKITRNK